MLVVKNLLLLNKLLYNIIISIMKSIYYRILMYMLRNGDAETRDYVRFILEHQAIKRGLVRGRCGFK